MNFLSGLAEVIFFTALYGLIGFSTLFFKGSFKNLQLNFRSAFLSLFMGISISVTLYSIIFSGGKTVHIILFPALAYLVYIIRRDSIPLSGNSPVKVLLVFIFGLALTYCFCYWGYTNNYDVADYVYYSKISYYLQKTGCENDYHIFNMLHADYRAVTPYHYFDLWLNTIHRFVFPAFSSLDTFLLITPTMLRLFVYFGFLAIYETERGMDVYGMFLCMLIIFFGGMFLPVYNHFIFLKSYEYCFDPYSVHNIGKYTPTILFILAGYVMARHYSLFAALLTWGLIPVISIVNLPAAGFAWLSLFIISRRYKQIDLTLREWLFAILPVLAVALFYHFFGNKIIVRGGTNAAGIISLLHNFTQWAFLRQKINILCGAALSAAIIYFFLLPLVYQTFIRKRNTVNTFFGGWVFSSCVGGALAWSFLSPKINAIQPYYHVLKAVPILIFISIISIDKKAWRYIAFAVVTVFAGIHILKTLRENQQNQSREFYAVYNAKAFPLLDTNGLLGFIRDSSEYVNPSAYYSTCYCPGIYLCAYNDPVFAINLSDYDIPHEQDTVLQQLNMEGLKMGLFYRYVQKEKENGKFVSVDDSRLKFIKKYNIRSMVLSTRASLPASLSPLVDSSIFIPGWKEKIIRLK